MLRFFVLLSMLFSLLFGAGAQANVTLKNGNFFKGYVDLVYSGGFEPKIERVYNSKSMYKGMFGWGWGSEYEVYLKILADGSVEVNEFGGGAVNRFTPVNFRPEELDRAVDQIVEVAKKAGVAGSLEQIKAYRSKLKGDIEFRNIEWEKFRARGLIQARQIPVNTQLVSNKYSYQFITKIQGGYVRSFDSGRIEKYNDSGKLVRIQDRNNNYIEFGYDPAGKLAKLVDNFNRKMFFTLNRQGLLEKVQGEGGKTAEYKYNNKDELIWAKDTENVVYAYKYSADNRHNLIEIGYGDKTTLQVNYYSLEKEKDKHESVKSIKDRDGSLTEYNYKLDPADKGHYTVTVTSKDSEGKTITTSIYEYYIKYKASGEEWTYKLITTLDGDKTETVYNECCGLPLIIKRGSEETHFEYDAKGHVTKKTTPTDITELSYNAQVGKVNRVVRYSRQDRKAMSWSTFEYDAKGNLQLAKNSENKAVKLFYDASGRIKSMIDQSKRRLDFEYNENSKPIKITDPQLGSITVSYTSSGEIKKVDSSAGRKVAVQVTTAFQNLLDIIRPAGVSLSF